MVSLKQKAFTLIELLVVIAIVGLLASIVLISLQGAAATARDGKRDAEAGEQSSALRKTLEVYHSTHGNYPWNAASEAADGCCLESNTGIKNDLAEYLSVDLEDPRYDPGVSDTDPEKYCYRYKTVNSGEDYKIKVLYERGGYKEVASWGGGGIAYEDPEITTFAKRFGRNSSGHGNYIQRTIDGGYILAGATLTPSSPSYDISIIKLDSAGNQVWDKTFGGDKNETSYFTQEVPGGGYVFVGDIGETGDPAENPTDAFILRLDSNGDQIWAKAFGDTGDDIAYSVIASAGGYVLVGDTENFGVSGKDFLIIKLDFNGEQIWAKTFGDTGDDIAYSVIASAGGYIVTGKTDNDILLLKLNSDGEQIWAKSFSASNISQCFTQEVPGGGYIVAGGASNDDVLVLKLNSDGDQIWAKTFGGINNDSAYNIQYTSTDGGYIVAGTTESFVPDGGISSSLVIKLDASGNKVWARTFTGDDSSFFGIDYSVFTSIQQVPGEGYIAGGYTGYCGTCIFNFLVVKLDLAGNINSCPLFQDITNDIIETELGDISSIAAEGISDADLGNIFIESLGDIFVSSGDFTLVDICPE